MILFDDPNADLVISEQAADVLETWSDVIHDRRRRVVSRNVINLRGLTPVSQELLYDVSVLAHAEMLQGQAYDDYMIHTGTALANLLGVRRNGSPLRLLRMGDDFIADMACHVFMYMSHIVLENIATGSVDDRELTVCSRIHGVEMWVPEFLKLGAIGSPAKLLTELLACRDYLFFLQDEFGSRMRSSRAGRTLQKVNAVLHTWSLALKKAKRIGQTF